jgi:hypothetical protein
MRECYFAHKSKKEAHTANAFPVSHGSIHQEWHQSLGTLAVRIEPFCEINIAKIVQKDIQLVSLGSRGLWPVVEGGWHIQSDRSTYPSSLTLNSG